MRNKHQIPGHHMHPDAVSDHTAPIFIHLPGIVLYP